MSSFAQHGNDEEIQPPQRPPSPPPHTTFAVRGVHTPTFSAFRPRDVRITSTQAITHIAWSCDGKKLAAVGIDRMVRVFQPEKSMETRSASLFSGAHSDEVDYVAWNPTHPELFCSSSQKDRRIVFWDARRPPVQINYAPDGESLLYVSSGNQLFFMSHAKDPDDSAAQAQWSPMDRAPLTASAAMFNHTGDSVILTHMSEHAIRIVDVPSLALRENLAAHVGGCVAAALDPRGRYLASGGYDSIVNLFDTSEWIAARTITVCEQAISDLSFSHDGEYLAIAGAGNYIDICATETGVPLHRVPALASSPKVTWHPSNYVIAYCGQTKPREGGPAPVAVISLFGPGL
ncbi:WD40-repeat-containing domain protein [Russula vinacea]|nr:WD40-repeat-containing domain protein [Russula vinacea]